MPDIRPVSDLQNYTEVLRDIAIGSPVFLTQNGRGRYVIIDMEEYEKQIASIRLFSELARSEKSAKERGLLSEEEADEVIKGL